MGKTKSTILGDHVDEQIAQQVQNGCHGTASDVACVSVEHHIAVQRLNKTIDEGYDSGFVDVIDWDVLDQRADQAAAKE
jgi:Uncharacterised protein family (UPF0156).